MNAISRLFLLPETNLSLEQATAVRVEGLSVGYGQELIVEGASLSVQTGERFAIVGPNGAGKSTLVKAMLGLLKPVAGKALFLDLPFYAARKHVAYVPQSDEIDWNFPGKVRDLVDMGRAVHLGLTGRLGQKDRAAVDKALSDVGLSELADRPLNELSGGQRRRALLARALCQGPQILVMDEPFQAIDENTRNRLLDVLDRFRDEGKTAVIVHHNMSDVRHLFDRVALVDGTVLTQGAPDEVLKSSAFVGAMGTLGRAA